MRISKVYRQSRIPASKLILIEDYLSQSNSASLGEPWGHRVRWHTLHYAASEEIKCESFPEVERAIATCGDTTRHITCFESITGRCLRIDTTNPTRIVLEADNRALTMKFVGRLEELLGLQERPRRVFLSHGRGAAWLEVRHYLEKDSHLDLEVVELAAEPNKGRTVSQKLMEEADHCSYVVILMTGDDLMNDGEVRARENVMHEIGFFQGRYGFDRVCLLHEEGVNIPSNLSGLVYCPFPKGIIKAAFVDLQKDLRTAFP